MTRSMRRYAAWRVAWLVPVLIGTSVITFVLTHMLSNPVYLLLGPTATQEALDAATHRLHLDLPLWEQYAIYLQGLVRGDLGQSWFTGRPVLDDLLSRFPATLELVTLALLLALVIGGTLGALAAMLRSRRGVDQAVRVFTALAVSMPSFWFGLILIYIAFFSLRWAPAPLGQLPFAITPPQAVTGSLLLDSAMAGDLEALGAHAAQLALPVLALAVGISGPIARQTRAAVLEVLASDFIYYARSCGLSRSRVNMYIVRNSAAPVVTLLGVLYGLLISGAALVEVVFSWGGLGQYAVQVMLQNDYPAIQGVVQLMALFSVIVYLLVDLLCLMLDPRITYQATS